MMLKLTNRRDRSAIYVTRDHIVSLTTSGQGTTVYVGGGLHHDVSETPDEIIMAMMGMGYMPPAPAPDSADTFRPIGDFAESAVQHAAEHMALDLGSLVACYGIRGNCGEFHPTFKEWQECLECGTAPLIAKLKREK